MRELEEQQRQIRDDLAQLLDDIESHANALPDEFEELRQSALEFVEAVRNSGAPGAMQQAEFALTTFAGSRAHEQAELARSILEKFLSQCEGMGEGAGQALKNSFSPSMSQCLSQTLEQLLADAGFKRGSGPGMGQGDGGGYSASRSTLSNIGLYGSLPQYSPPSEQGGGSAREAAASGGRPGQPRPEEKQANGYLLSGQEQGSGAGEASAPLKYRRQVGRYFQRLADELGVDMTNNGNARKP
jgi:hypothetical protein